MYGFCYTRVDSKGATYKHCPGYSKQLQLPQKEMNKIVNVLVKNGYGKHSSSVASKMIRSGRGMNEYSKTTGRLKKAFK
jgi:CRISPR/Cas system-associated protein endoribonuclease Cas2